MGSNKRGKNKKRASQTPTQDGANSHRDSTSTMTSPSTDDMMSEAPKPATREEAGVDGKLCPFCIVQTVRYRIGQPGLLPFYSEVESLRPATIL